MSPVPNPKNVLHRVLCLTGLNSAGLSPPPLVFKTVLERFPFKRLLHCGRFVIASLLPLFRFRGECSVCLSPLWGLDKERKFIYQYSVDSNLPLFPFSVISLI